jgi:hypothetical protein
VSTIQAILEQEYVSWVETEAVTCTIYATSGGAGPGTTINVAITSHLKDDRPQRMFGEFYHDTNTKIWVIPDALLNPSANGNVLKNGDVIKDASGVNWRIEKVNRVKIDTQWICLSIKQL